MDEIKKLIFDLAYYEDNITGKKADLKRLIELVENEQVKGCTNAHCLGQHPNGELEWDEHAVDRTLDAPRVSEQIEWEEL